MLLIMLMWFNWYKRASLLDIFPPSQNTLARNSKKRSLFLAFLQDLAKSCKVLCDFARILQESCCKISVKSYKISQDLAGMQEKRTFSWNFLQECFYWVCLWTRIYSIAIGYCIQVCVMHAITLVFEHHLPTYVCHLHSAIRKGFL